MAAALAKARARPERQGKQPLLTGEGIFAGACLFGVMG